MTAGRSGVLFTRIRGKAPRTKSTQVRGWLSVIGALAAMVAVLLPASPAAADAVRPAGACVGTGTWSDFTISTTEMGYDSYLLIPRADSVAWTGRVVGPEPGARRSINGRIALDLPWPLGVTTLGTWGGSATGVDKSGTYSYNLPWLVPSGVEFYLIGVHNESGQRHCFGEVALEIEGGPFESPLIWIALAGLLLSGVGLTLLGRGSAGGPTSIMGGVAAALVGILVGLFLAATLILFGVVPLASPWLAALTLLGLLGGGAWGYWRPLGGGASQAPAS